MAQLINAIALRTCAMCTHGSPFAILGVRRDPIGSGGALVYYRHCIDAAYFMYSHRLNYNLALFRQPREYGDT